MISNPMHQRRNLLSFISFCIFSSGPNMRIFSLILSCISSLSHCFIRIISLTCTPFRPAVPSSFQPMTKLLHRREQAQHHEQTCTSSTDQHPQTYRARQHRRLSCPSKPTQGVPRVHIRIKVGLPPFKRSILLVAIFFDDGRARLEAEKVRSERRSNLTAAILLLVLQR